LIDVRATNSATKVVAKFKQLRRLLKKWAKGISKLKEQIKQCNVVLLIMDKLEENRDLYPPERNFRQILKKYILKLLHNQKTY
jgi:chaperonin cofactor prefoldin